MGWEGDGEYLIQIVNRCYDAVVHWRRNLFKIPSGKVGVAFVHELSRLFQAYAESSALEGVALKAAMILPALLLQKPHARSRTKEHTKHLERRLNLWKDGDLASLLDEGQTIQSSLTREYSGWSSLSDQLTRKFSKLMMEGKVRAALRLIADNNTGQPLHLNSQIDFKLTRKELETSCWSNTLQSTCESKHPCHRPPSQHLWKDWWPAHTQHCLKNGWNCWTIRFGCSSVETPLPLLQISLHWAICDSLAAVARRLSTTLVDPRGLSASFCCMLTHSFGQVSRSTAHRHWRDC